jgi:hypothetical protein
MYEGGAVNPVRCLYDFRKVDGVWQRRNIYGGPWLNLHIERKQEPMTQKLADRGERIVYATAYNEWKWIET